MLVLGEKLPDPGPRLWWYLLSWACVLLGVTGLSGGLKQTRSAGAAAGAGGTRGGLHGSGGSGLSLATAGGKGADWSGGLHHLPRSLLGGGGGVSGKGPAVSTLLPV